MGWSFFAESVSLKTVSKPKSFGAIFCKGIASFGRTITLCCCLVMLGWQCYVFDKLVVPVKTSEAKDSKEYAEIVYNLQKLGAPEKLVPNLGVAIEKASKDTGFDHLLLVALMKTESSFNPKAVSSKGYKGLMQTPHMTGWNDIDVMIGARILKEKMGYADNDLAEALALYKGGRNPMARKQASQVLSLYSKIKTQTKVAMAGN